MKLFISHASEDKAAFVRPLAEALRRKFEVWYDEYELMLGDSLLQKINEGLAACNYGVVILSPSFFGKKWPRAELDGLFALESTTHKIILPIWKEVSLEDVTGFSPILAGRFAANASEGIERVVREICKAVQVSNRTRVISASDVLVQKMKLVDQTLKERQITEQLSSSEEGVGLVRAGFDFFCSMTESLIAEAQKTSEVLKFHVTRSPMQPFGPMITIRTVCQLGMDVQLVHLGGNYTHGAELQVLVYKRQPQRFGIQGKADVIRDLKFAPTFRLPKEAIWLETGSKRTYGSEELASYLLDGLVKEVQTRGRTG
jgi:hypothetical protein